MPDCQVAVTGLGAVTPAGIGADESWKGLLSGLATAARDPELAGLPVDISCRVPRWDARERLGARRSWRLDRFTQLAIHAAREAVTDARLDISDCDPARIGVVIGSGTASMERYGREIGLIERGRVKEVSPLAITRSVPNMAAAEIALDLGTTGCNLAVSTACASGASALGVARDLVRSGTCDIVLAGGAESVCCPIPAACFSQMGALSRRTDDPQSASRPFDADRDGFVLSEGAAVLVLERLDHAIARAVPPRALLVGFGASCDAHHYAAPHPQGDGAVLAVRSALRDAGITPADVHHVNAHGTGTVLNDRAEHQALRRIFGDPPPVTATKGTLGHAVGAAGAIEAVCTVLALEQQLIPPTANLDRLEPGIDLDVVTRAPRRARMELAVSTSFGFGGQNACLVLARA
ncbi:beta-ketoacyl-[acyl-carrier-protein] synthase family protein [Streptomyces sp. NPDC001393]